eukprot:gene16353-biopygen6759
MGGRTAGAAQIEEGIPHRPNMTEICDFLQCLPRVRPGVPACERRTEREAAQLTLGAFLPHQRARRAVQYRTTKKKHLYDKSCTGAAESTKKRRRRTRDRRELERVYVAMIRGNREVAGVACAWRGHGAGCRLRFGMSGAGAARAWRGRGAGLSC